MGELLDFITDNPVAGIFIAWFLYRFFFGGKDKAKKAQEQQAEMKAAGGTRKKTFQERLEEALKEAQSAAQGTTQSGQSTLLETTRAVVQQPSRQPVATTVTTSPNDPFAFHSLTSPTKERADYDLNKESFAYHEAIDEPVEQAFHLKGFTGFHEAHGLSHGSLIMTPLPSDEESQQTSGMPDFLGAEGGMHRAIILSEILGKPRALRRLGS